MSWKISPARKGNLVFALAASLGVLILHGFSFFVIAIFLYAAGTALIRGHSAGTVIAIIFGGLSLLFIRGSQGSALLTIGAVLAVVFSDSRSSRYLFSLSAAVVLLSGAFTGVVPIALALFASSSLHKYKWRGIVVAGGLSAGLIFFGLPLSQAHNSLVSQEVLVDGKVLWSEPAELNLGMPELILQAPGIEASCITLTIHAGGVRDINPVGYVFSADRTFPVYPGENTLEIEEPEFPLSIRMSRSWKLFTHPVIHFNSAEASF